MSYGRKPYYIYAGHDAVNWYGAEADDAGDGSIRIKNAAMRQFLHHWIRDHPEARTIFDLIAVIDTDFPDPAKEDASHV
jgi:hypothetical protein